MEASWLQRKMPRDATCSCELCKEVQSQSMRAWYRIVSDTVLLVHPRLCKEFTRSLKATMIRIHSWPHQWALLQFPSIEKKMITWLNLPSFNCPSDQELELRRSSEF